MSSQNQAYKHILTVMYSVCICFTMQSGELFGGTPTPTVTSCAVESDSLGNMVAIWTEPSDGVHVIMASTGTFAEGTWNTPQQLSLTDAQSNNMVSSGPKLTLNSSGNVVAIWLSQDKTGSSNLYAATISLQGSAVWSSTTLVSSTSTAVQSNYSVQLNDANQSVVIWTEISDTFAPITKSSTSLVDGSNTWSTPAILGASNKKMPALKEKSVLQTIQNKVCNVICPNNNQK